MKYQHSNVLKMSQHNIKESSSTNQCTLFRVSTIPLITSSMKVCSSLLCSNCRLISTGLSSNMRESSFSRDMLLAANGPARQYLHTVNNTGQGIILSFEEVHLEHLYYKWKLLPTINAAVVSQLADMDN